MGGKILSTFTSIEDRHSSTLLIFHVTTLPNENKMDSRSLLVTVQNISLLEDLLNYQFDYDYDARKWKIIFGS